MFSFIKGSWVFYLLDYLTVSYFLGVVLAIGPLPLAGLLDSYVLFALSFEEAKLKVFLVIFRIEFNPFLIRG